MSLKCYFHPDREATTKCEKCERMLCIECKEPYTVTHGVDDSRYATQHDLCMPCYYDIEMHKYRNPGRGYHIVLGVLITIILILDILGIYLLSVLTIAGTGMLATSAVPTFLFVILLLHYISAKKRNPGMLAELKKKKEKYLKALEIGGVCPGCGNKLEVGISICPSCGSIVAG